MCAPERDCENEAVTQALQDVTPVTPRPPARLRARGRRLWEGLGGEGDLSPDQRVMIEEIARVADRLEKLDRILTDDDVWVTLQAGKNEGDPMVVIVDGALREVRQQQLALKQLSAELRAMRGGELGGAKGEVDPLDELARKRADRRTGTGNS